MVASTCCQFYINTTHQRPPLSAQAPPTVTGILQDPRHFRKAYSSSWRIDPKPPMQNHPYKKSASCGTRPGADKKTNPRSLFISFSEG